MEKQLSGPPTLTLVDRCDSLNVATAKVEGWIDDAEMRGFGSAYLGFDGHNWLVLVTSDLTNRLIPF